MKIGFIGNFQRSYSGEQADETHLSNEIENLGHTVCRIPRDEWREHVRDGKHYVNVPDNVTFDLVILCKWHHFYSGIFAEKAREKYKCKVFYFVWDYMYGEGFPEWHINMIKGADLYLGNDVRLVKLYEPCGIPAKKLYYFPMDVSDKQFDRWRKNEPGLPYVQEATVKYDVTFFGSHFGKGDRVEWLKIINQIHPVKVFASNWEDWKKIGFDAEASVYYEDFAAKVAESRITLGFNVNDHCWGYWSNRVGKVLTVGGFLLQRYVPGMELFLRDGVAYFSSPDEAIQKIAYYLQHSDERQAIADRGYEIGRDRFTSQARIKELMIFIDRFLKGGV